MSIPSRRSRAIRLLINVGLIVTVAAIVLGNMTDDGPIGSLKALTQPYRGVTGLNQNWAVYSPPRDISAYVDARVDYADGASSVYPIPARPGIGTYVDYRWQKYEEVIRPDSGEQQWAAYAEYLADRARADGHDPVRVTLVRRWAETLPPGPGPERGPWHQHTMYTKAVA